MGLPRWVKRRLLAGERTHVTAQRHWAQLVGTVAGVVAGFAVLLWLGSRHTARSSRTTHAANRASRSSG
ncbi:hypothetical protein, partial [Kineococcus indalonis]|uniref:hypothetical protein n=1 Tax=Kineococcus indalonis TaxID=2696566 RepID=UPI00196A5C28